MLTDSQITDLVTEVLEQLMPYFLMHGGNITLDHYKDGVVYVKLSGACGGCASSTYTLKLLVEAELKKEVPQIKEVVEV